MAKAHRERVEELFFEALDLDGQARSALLRRLHASEPAVASELRAMLRADAHPTIAPLRAAPLHAVLGESRPAWADEPPPEQIGPYRVGELLGRGGFGAVYRARQTDPVERDVAIKLLIPGLATPDAVNRFQRERRTLALLDHPNIARLLEAGQTASGRPYVVMELVAGRSIVEHCDEACLGTESRLLLFLQACEAILHAHQRAVIHRDIKPSNVMVAGGGSNAPLVKVIDFGIAGFLNTGGGDRTRITAAGQFVGTPEYMSPEQLADSHNSADIRTDVYSLGVLLHELLTGVLPHSRSQVLAASVTGRTDALPEPRRPSSRIAEVGSQGATARGSDSQSLARRLRRDLDWIILKAIERDPGRRYPSVSELAADIRHHLADEPILARSPSRPEQWRRFYRRNRPSVIAVLLLLIALIGGVIGTSFGLVSARTARREAEHKQALAETSEALAESRRKVAEQQAYSAGLASAAALLDSFAPGPTMQRLQSLPEVPRGWEWWSLVQRADTSDYASAVGGFVQHLTIDSTGTLLAACVTDPPMIVLLEASTGAILKVLPQRGQPMGAAFSPDGTTLAVADGGLCLWSTRTFRRLPVSPERLGPLRSIAYSPDGSTLATLEASGSDLHLTLLRNDGSILQRTNLPAYMDVDWSPDGQHVACGGSRGRLSVWDVARGSVAYQVNLSSELVTGVAFSPDGRLLAVCEQTGLTRLLNRSDWTQIGAIEVRDTYAFRLAFSRDSRYLAITGRAGVTMVTEVDGFGVLPRPAVQWLRGHTGVVHGIRFSPDGGRVYSGSYDGTVRAWTPVRTTTLEFPPNATAGFSVQLSRDASRCLSPVTPTHWIIRSTTDASLVSQFVVDRPGASSGLFHPDGRRVYMATQSSVVLVDPEDLSSCQAIARSPGHQPFFISSLSPNGRYLGVDVYLHGGAILDLQTGDTAWGWPTTAFQRLLGFLSDSTAFGVTFDGRIQIWDFQSAQALQDFETPDQGAGWAAAAPTAGLLAAATVDRLALFDINTGRLLAQSDRLTAYPGTISMTPDGQRVICVGEDGMAKFFEVPSLRLVCELRACSLWSAGTLSLDGQTLAIRGQDGQQVFWRVPAQAVGRRPARGPEPQ